MHQRLDRDTSGLVAVHVAARGQRRDRRAVRSSAAIEKTYVAASAGAAFARSAASVVLEHALARGRDGRMQVVSPHVRGAKRARTRVSTARAPRRARAARARLRYRPHAPAARAARARAARDRGRPLYGDTPALRCCCTPSVSGCAIRRTGARWRCERPRRSSSATGSRMARATRRRSPSCSRARSQLACESRYRLGRARRARQPTTAFRLFHHAADGAAELAVDVYGDHLWRIVFGGRDRGARGRGAAMRSPRSASAACT